MKNNFTCLKCNSQEIKKINALPIQIKVGFKPIWLNHIYYICCNCGYMETLGRF